MDLPCNLVQVIKEIFSSIINPLYPPLFMLNTKKDSEKHNWEIVYLHRKLWEAIEDHIDSVLACISDLRDTSKLSRIFEHKSILPSTNEVLH